MASSTNKKVVAVRYDREPVAGFVNPSAYLQPSGIEVLTTAGNLVALPYAEVKALCFVKDVEPADVWRPNQAFAARPKAEGLWVRFQFRDGDSIEGLVSANLLNLETQGFTLTPPDAGGPTPRIFVPRASLSDVRVLGVIGASGRGRKPKPKPVDQLEMFD